MTEEPDYCTEVRGVQILTEVAATAASNKRYRRELLDNPKKVLSDAGIRGLKDVQVIVHVNTADVIHLVLPAQAEKISLREVNLSKLSPCLHF